MWDFYLPLFAIPVASITQRIVKRSTQKAGGRFEESIQTLRAKSWGLSIATIYLWFCLPQTSSLSTFGRPDFVSDLASPEQMLEHLVEYNIAICQISNVVLCFFILFAAWLHNGVIKLLNVWSDLSEVSLSLRENRQENSDTSAL